LKSKRAGNHDSLLHLQRLLILGLVLTLLIRRLMERTVRLSLSDNRQQIAGCEKRHESRPISFTMTSKFLGIFVITPHLVRRLAKPLTPVRLRYLQILQTAPDIFTRSPENACLKKIRPQQISQNSSWVVLNVG